MLSFLLQLLLHPATWVVALILWLLARTPSTAPKRYKYDVSLPPGTFTTSGSGKTSKTEYKVRDFIKKSGWRTMDQGTGLVVPSRDAKGNRRHFTPDIIIYGPGKKTIIVEVDPHYHHGAEGLHKVYEDVERNVEYSKLGFAVVRLRIDFDNKPAEGFARLSPNDVVVTQSEFTNGTYRHLLRGAIKRAKPLSPHTWDDQLQNLRPYHLHAKRGG